MCVCVCVYVCVKEFLYDAHLADPCADPREHKSYPTDSLRPMPMKP